MHQPLDTDEGPAAAGPESWDRRAQFAHKCLIIWFDLVATGKNSEAHAWGHMLDAIFLNDPSSAILRARVHGLPESVIHTIFETFDLTDDRAVL